MVGFSLFKESDGRLFAYILKLHIHFVAYSFKDIPSGNYSASIYNIYCWNAHSTTGGRFPRARPSLLVVALLRGLGFLAYPAGVASLHSMCFSFIRIHCVVDIKKQSEKK